MDENLDEKKVQTIAWVTFDGKLVLDGKERDPTLKWFPLAYWEDAEQIRKTLEDFGGLTGRQNQIISELHGELLAERIRSSALIYKTAPSWNVDVRPPIGKMLIGLWFDDKDADDWEIFPCKVELTAHKEIVWVQVPHGYSLEIPPDAWTLAPAVWPNREVPF